MIQEQITVEIAERCRTDTTSTQSTQDHSISEQQDGRRAYQEPCRSLSKN
ncbi:hypothetical protein RRSWK_01549 [Rhodopirellula sp. SWK7]|nr:hypothetical protein RRSWK_01549 [Rhodopirellula sp. SWK7]